MHVHVYVDYIVTMYIIHVHIHVIFPLLIIQLMHLLQFNTSSFEVANCYLSEPLLLCCCPSNVLNSEIFVHTLNERGSLMC